MYILRVICVHKGENEIESLIYNDTCFLKDDTSSPDGPMV